MCTFDSNLCGPSRTLQIGIDGVSDLITSETLKPSDDQLLSCAYEIVWPPDASHNDSVILSAIILDHTLTRIYLAYGGDDDSLISSELLTQINITHNMDLPIISFPSKIFLITETPLNESTIENISFKVSARMLVAKDSNIREAREQFPTIVN